MTEQLRTTGSVTRVTPHQPEPIIGAVGGLRVLRWAGLDQNATTLVLLHGMGDGADVWRATVARFRSLYLGDILAVELPGHWGSDWRADGYYGLVETAQRVCDAIGASVTGPLCLAGHSLGARIATYIATRKIIALDSVVLIDMNPDPSEDGWDAVHDHIDALNHPPFDGPVLSQIAIDRLPFCDPAAVRQYLDAAVDSLAKTACHSVDPAVLEFDVTDADCWALLATIPCPTAIIRGALSSILPATVAHRSAMTLRSCLGFHVVPKAGHAIPLEQPDRLAALLHTCCEATDAARSTP